MICDYCSKQFQAVNDENDIPGGVSMILSDGSRITLCRECIMSPDIAYILRQVREKQKEGKQ